MLLRAGPAFRVRPPAESSGQREERTFGIAHNAHQRSAAPAGNEVAIPARKLVAGSPTKRASSWPRTIRDPVAGNLSFNPAAPEPSRAPRGRVLIADDDRD